MNTNFQFWIMQRKRRNRRKTRYFVFFFIIPNLIDEYLSLCLSGRGTSLCLFRFLYWRTLRRRKTGFRLKCWRASSLIFMPRKLVRKAWALSSWVVLPPWSMSSPSSEPSRVSLSVSSSSMVTLPLSRH